MPDQEKENYMANMSNQLCLKLTCTTEKNCVLGFKTSTGNLYILTNLMPYSNYVFISLLLCQLYSVYKSQLIYAIIRAKRCLYECKQPGVKLNNKNKRIIT